MKTISSRLMMLAAAVLLVCGAAGIASADTVPGELNLGAPGWDVGAELTTSGTGIGSGTWTLTLDFNNTSGNTVDINSFSIQMFQAGAGESFSVSSASLNGGAFTLTGGTLVDGVWQTFADDKLNNGTNPDCNAANSANGWLCADTASGGTLAPFSIASGSSADFSFTGTYQNTGAISELDLMASGCLSAGTCSLDGGSNNGNKWAVSQGMPEPSTLISLLCGMAALLGFALVRRRSLVS